MPGHCHNACMETHFQNHSLDAGHLTRSRCPGLSNRETVRLCTTDWRFLIGLSGQILVSPRCQGRCRSDSRFRSSGPRPTAVSWDLPATRLRRTKVSLKQGYGMRLRCGRKWHDLNETNNDNRMEMKLPPAGLNLGSDTAESTNAKLARPPLQREQSCRDADLGSVQIFPCEPRTCPATGRRPV